MKELILKFLIGGLVVSLFAVLGDIFRPKTFAGLFGAAPSIALATLGLTVAGEGKPYAATEAHAMIAGALAFFLYASAVSWAMMRYKKSALLTTMLLLPVWLAGALGLWLVALRSGQ